MDKQLLKKIDSYFTRFKHQIYKKGEILVRADEDPTGIFYLRKGIVKEYAISKKGDELVLNIFKPVSFFPMSWAINNTPNNYFFEAITDLEVWKIPKDQALTFIKNNPDILYDLLSRLYKGTDGLLTRITYLMSGNAYTRLITELLIQARRFGKQDNNKISIEIKASEKELAAQSGMSRETVSREIKHLKDKKLLQFVKNTLIINNLSKLENELTENI